MGVNSIFILIAINVSTQFSKILQLVKPVITHMYTELYSCTEAATEQQ